jgi:hypothetical protein
MQDMKISVIQFLSSSKPHMVDNNNHPLPPIPSFRFLCHCYI